jgi:hypothetical protein
MPTEPMVAAIGRIAWLAVGGGLLVTLAALGWWASFYGDVIGREGQGSLANAISCLYSRSGICGFIPSMAHEAGKMAYSPAVFWLGISLLLSGVATRLVLARRG